MNVGHIIFTVVWCYIECKLNRKEKRTSVSWSGRQQTAPLRCLSDHTAGHVYIMLSCRSGFHSHYECIRFYAVVGFDRLSLINFLRPPSPLSLHRPRHCSPLPSPPGRVTSSPSPTAPRRVTLCCESEISLLWLGGLALFWRNTANSLKHIEDVSTLHLSQTFYLW